MALAYLLGKASAKPLKVNINIPLILVLSIIPDIDILAGVDEIHRGPTHSAIAAVLVFIPFFVVYRRRAVPYFLALVSHGLIGDLLIGGDIQLLWPITTQNISLPSVIPYISIFSLANLILELTLFMFATVIMLKTKDLLTFFQNHTSNLVLAIPIFTVLLPTFVGFPFMAPLLITLPFLGLAHLFYLVLFSASILTVILRRQK